MSASPSISTSPRAERAPAMVLCSATSLDVLEEWIAGAAPGHTAEYARGFVPPREHPVWKRAGDLARAGQVTLTTRRDEIDARVTVYLIVKCDGGPGVAAPGSTPKPKPIDLTAMQKAILMKKLRQLAERGSETASYSDLAAHLELRRDARGKGRVRTLIKGLEKDGLVKVHPGDALRGPAFTIMGTGRARGKSTKRTEHKTTAVERAAQLFTSLGAEAQDGELSSAELDRIREDHGLDAGEWMDALNFLEANRAISVCTVVVVHAAKRGVAA